MRSYKYHPYINEHLRNVEQGLIHSCNEMKTLMSIIRDVLDDPDVYFDAKQVEEYVRITEHYYFDLMPDQKFYACLILGLFYKSTGMLVFNQIFIMAGRGWGKNGFISSLAHFFISKYHGIKKYAVDIVATSEEQAQTSFDEVYETIHDMGEKGKRLYNYNKTHITDRTTRSKIRYRTSLAKTKDGGRPGVVIFDEVHAYENYDNIKVFTGGLGKVPRPRRIYITTEGEIREGVIDDYKARAARILDGEEKHKGFLPIIMKLDTIQEVGKPELWDKANPRINYDKTLKHEIETEYDEMLSNENLKEAFITKRMNLVFVSKSRTVCALDDLMAASKREWPSRTDFTCIGSIDFAEISDFAFAGIRFKHDGKNYFRGHTWIHEKALHLKNYNIDIDECVSEGWATIVRTSESQTINGGMLAKWFQDRAKEGYYITKINADLYRYQAIKSEFEKFGLPEVNMVRSGPATHAMVGPVIDKMFSDGTIVLEDDKLLRWMFWNVEKKIDKKGNTNYLKIEPIRRKTDGFFAFLHNLACDDLEESSEPLFLDVRTF